MQIPLRRILFILLISVFAFASAEETCPPEIDTQQSPETILAAMENAQDRGFLWRISKNGHTSYLYGTIHVAKPEWLFPGPKVLGAIRATDTVALELDMLDEDIKQRFVRGMASLHGVTLPRSLVIRLQHQADTVCVPYESIATMTPEFQIATLSLFAGRWIRLDASLGIDSMMSGIGHGAGKDVVSLETPEAQLNMLQMPTRQETITFVEDSLEDLESGRTRNMLGKVAKVWSEADFGEMTNYGAWCECRDTEVERDMMKRLLDDRNPGLSERIDALHTSGRQVFVAVGSLHMFGQLGLPALMEQRGYRVERVDFDKR